MLKRLNNQKGVTLTELIVAMLVMSIIMLAVTAVFLPMYNAYINANSMAEVNNLLNALSSVIMNDIEDAEDIDWDDDDGTLTITRVGAPREIHYTIGTGAAAGLLLRNGTPVFAGEYYKGKTVQIGYAEEAAGISAVTLTILGVTRTYAARPVGMQGVP
ncbi:MAG: prepilin-type N-terminal cleavage/methylation domain-containing protein [Oscillospiraceae bacterium]|nr:prepilin-type N-terminal cleavage/methylation domain-containing protein [Oscillospiraceae bacterium]